MNSTDLHSDGSFAIWRERSTIAECLRDLDMPILAVKSMKDSATRELIDSFLNIIWREANRLQRHDVLERLFFAGLIYG